MCEDTDTLAELKTQSFRLKERVRMVACDLEGAVWTASPQHDHLFSVCDYLGQFSLEYFRNTAIRCRVDVGADIPPVPVRPDVRHHIFMIAKEAMHNVLKHSGATKARLIMRVEAGSFALALADNGGGFDPAAQSSGRSGLRNMRGRAAEIGGSLEIASSAQGTTVRLTVPLAEPEVRPPRA